MAGRRCDLDFADLPLTDDHFGYDILDYCAVDPIFGTLDDVDQLLRGAHRRGIRIILDLVPNHTSDRHPWFLESRASRASRNRDWYIWRDAKADGAPPNNWMSNFGGSAWTWDDATQQYYYHAFLKEQPDLNWRNFEVRAALYAAMRFWLDRGVDGFRVDVLWHLIKDEAFRDNPANPAFAAGQPDINRFLQLHSADQPEITQVIAGMRQVVDAYRDRVLIGEIYLPIERLVTYYGVSQQPGVHLPFNFQLLFTSWKASSVAALIDEYEQALPTGAWPNWVLGNHDQPRIATRVGTNQARVAAMLLLTLRGTPTLYYGDEIGMQDVPMTPDVAKDPWAKREPGLGVGRDPQRTPMQWDGSGSAGFCEGTPWLPVALDYARTNVASQRDDPTSALSLHRQLIALRRANPALREGTYRPLSVVEDVLCYERATEGQQVAVALNLGDRPTELTLPALSGKRVLLSTDCQRTGCLAPSMLQPNEGVVIGNASDLGAPAS